MSKIVLLSHQLAAFHSQYQWTRIYLSLTNFMAMRTQLGFKRHREVVIHLSVPENYGFDTVILPLWVLEVHINGITGVTIHIIESKIQKS